MKKQFFFAIAAIATLALTSCQKDSFVDPMSPDTDFFKTTTTVENSSSIEDAFYFDEQILLIAGSVPGSEERKGMSRMNVQPTVALSGFGDSEIQNVGSWYLEIDLEYNPNAQAISGTLNMEFPDYGDKVDFVVYGGPAKVTQRIDGQQVEVLVMQLAIKSGTGRFADKKFEGSATLTPVNNMSSGEALKPQLQIEGLLVKTQ